LAAPAAAGVAAPAGLKLARADGNPDIMRADLAGPPVRRPGSRRRAGDNQSIMSEQALPTQTTPQIDALALESEIAQLIVKGLNLPMQPDGIDPEAPLYGEGLGLDSIDILEIALIVSKQYGIQLRADNQENARIFRSLRHFAQYVAEQRVK
jgi:acyl carrier protein